MQSFLTALSFLTIIPIRFREQPSPEVVARARFWFPVAGIVLGAALGGWTALMAAMQLPMLGAFLVLVVWVGLTGGLHLDGLCDLCDGLFGGKTPEERLNILKDPHLGSFGLIGGVGVLLGKFVGLQALLERSTFQAPLLIAVGVIAARCFVLTMAAGARYPRENGTGKVLVEATTTTEGFLNLAYAAC